MNTKDTYELDYWKMLKTTGQPHDIDYAKVQEIFGPIKTSSVLEIGCGPWMGQLPFIDSDTKVAVDPLLDEYKRAGILTNESSIQLISATFEAYADSFHGRLSKFKTIISVNSLDHGDMGFHTLATMATMLAAGGRIYLLVDLRRPQELNEGHDHALTMEQFYGAVEDAGLTIEKTVTSKAKYVQLAAILRKP